MNIITVRTNEEGALVFDGSFPDTTTAAAKAHDNAVLIVSVEDMAQFDKKSLIELFSTLTLPAHAEGEEITQIAKTNTVSEVREIVFAALQSLPVSVKVKKVKKSDTPEAIAAKEAKKSEREAKKAEKAEKQPRGRSLKDQLRDLFAAGRILSANDINEEIYKPAGYEITPFTIGTSINNLKSAKNCGKDGSIVIISGLLNSTRVYCLDTTEVTFDVKPVVYKPAKKSGKALLDKVNEVDGTEEKDNSDEQPGLPGVEA